MIYQAELINTLRQRQNSRHLPDDIFKCIFLHENVSISIKISLKFVPGGSINNIPALVQIMAWHRPGDKPLSEPMMVSSPTHTCVTQPQWANCWDTYICNTNKIFFRNLITVDVAASMAAVNYGLLKMSSQTMDHPRQPMLVQAGIW